jgi:4a-hydroxytetrahydrobiopterin dehydratase
VTWLRSRSVFARPAGRREPANAERMRKLSWKFPIGNSATRAVRRFRFPDYRTALAFTNAVSALAEETWHHPELVLGWGYCEVSLTTRKIGGLHESDFVMTARIDALAAGPLDTARPPPPARR